MSDAINFTDSGVGFKNGKNIENEIWIGELLKPVVTGYTDSDELYYRFETDKSGVNNYLSFYTSDMGKLSGGTNYLYLLGEAYAAICSSSNYIPSPSQITCSVYTMKKEDGKFAATKIASKIVNLTTDNFISDDAAANEKEFEQNDVVVMQQGDSATLAELLGKAGFTHVTCSNAHMADITTSSYGENELTVDEITGGDRNTVITASETETGLSKLTFDFWSKECVYHGTSYSKSNPLKVEMYIYVVAKPEFQTTANSITVIDNTGSDATSTYQIGLGEPATTFTGLKENTEYDVLQTLTVEVDDEDCTGVYHNYVKTEKKPPSVSRYLSLGNDLTMVYKVSAPGYDEIALTVTVGEEEKAIDDEHKYVDEDGYTVFEYTGINPQCMADDLTVKVLLDGTEYKSFTDSVKDYSQAVLNGYAEDYGELVSNLLTYGAEAQNYNEYNTGNLATDGVKYLDPEDYYDAQINKVTKYNKVEPVEGGISFTGKTPGLVLNNAVSVRVYFDLGEGTDIGTVKIGAKIMQDGKAVRDEVILTPAYKDGQYYVDFNDVMATELDNEIIFTAYVNGDTDDVLHYNVNQCIKEKHTGVADALLEALFNYGYTCNYFKN